MHKIVLALTAAALLQSAYAAQIIAEDLAVQGSECVGMDCEGNESFGYDTIRLKENNVRIGFEDTSSSGSFPSNDWAIKINDSLDGGANYFEILDTTGGLESLKIMAGSQQYAIVTSEDKVGMGTSLPEKQLHILNCNTPTIRLEQTSECGWPAERWDIAAHEMAFRIVNMDLMEQTPFWIESRVPTYSFYLKSNGDTGIGTRYPRAKLDVSGTAYMTNLYVDNYTRLPRLNMTGKLDTNDTIESSGEILLTRNVDNTDNVQRVLTMSADNANPDKNSDVGVVLKNVRKRFAWLYQTLEPRGGFLINKEGSGVAELVLLGNDRPGGMQLILGNGAKNSGGQWLDASSREYKENIADLDAEAAMEAFDKLKPVTYTYKTDDSENVVGFIAEDVPELVAVNGRDALSALEIAALLTKVV